MSFFVIAFCLATSWSAVTIAGPITTFEFSGFITNIYDPTNLLNEQVQIGTPFDGNFSVDLSTPDSDSFNGGRGIYANAITTLEGQVGPIGFTGPTPLSKIDIRDGGVLDILMYTSNVLFAEQQMDFLLYLSDTNGIAIDGDDIPLFFDLPSFTTAEFTIADITETIPLAVQGQITAMVPEPSSLALLLGVLAIVGARSRRYAGHFVTHRKCFVMSCLLLLTLTWGAKATDCNGNGIADSAELGSNGDCTVDVVFVFDTSSSMAGIVSQVCDVATSLQSALTLAGTDHFVQRLAITSGNQVIQCTASSCCGTADVPTDYGTTTTGLGTNEVLGMCTGGEAGGDGNQEDWGVAIAVVAGERNWRTGALRVVIPVSDEGPLCGNPINNPGDDATLIGHAIDILQDHYVMPLPIIGSATALNTITSTLVSGVGRGQVFHFDDDGLAAKIAAYVVRHCPTDCNDNGVLDECDIANSTSCDEDEDGLPDECYACCTDGVCKNRISENCSSDTSSFYHGMTCSGCSCQDFAPCCLDGGCCLLPACACRAAGGVPKVGTAVNCASATCQTGACCFQTCADDVSQEDCGAFPWYPGTTCDSFPFVCDLIDQCPLAEIDTAASTNPANNVVDARYPHPPNNPTSLRGIGYEGTGAVVEDEIQIKLVNNGNAVTGATAVECWCLCETTEDAALGRNSISCVEELGNGFYRIHLQRPITTHQITTISYKTSSNFMTYVSHPANVNGDSSSHPTDILALIDYLNGVGSVPWGKWSCDLDRSGLCAPADIITLIDMLNGANGFATWSGTSKPTSTDCPALTYCDFATTSCGFGSSSMSSGFESNPATCDVECFSLYIVDFLTEYDGSGSIIEEDLTFVIQAFHAWAGVNYDYGARKALDDALSFASYASESGFKAAAELVSLLEQ